MPVATKAFTKLSIRIINRRKALPGTLFSISYVIAEADNQFLDIVLATSYIRNRQSANVIKERVNSSKLLKCLRRGKRLG